MGPVGLLLLGFGLVVGVVVVGITNRSGGRPLRGRSDLLRANATSVEQYHPSEKKLDESRHGAFGVFFG